MGAGAADAGPAPSTMPAETIAAVAANVPTRIRQPDRVRCATRWGGFLSSARTTTAGLPMAARFSFSGRAWVGTGERGTHIRGPSLRGKDGPRPVTRRSARSGGSYRSGGESLERRPSARTGDAVDGARVAVGVLQQALQRLDGVGARVPVDVARVAPVRGEAALEGLPTFLASAEVRPKFCVA